MADGLTSSMHILYKLNPQETNLYDYFILLYNIEVLSYVLAVVSLHKIFAGVA